MAITQSPKKQSTAEGAEDDQDLSNECKELILSLPKEKGWRTRHIYLFQGFWCQPKEIQSVLSFQRHFQAQDSDIVLSTIPKSGTTWLKALAFAIANRDKHPISQKKSHPLLTSNPHDLVPFFEYKVYASNDLPDLSKFPQPRIFGTHIPFPALAEPVKSSQCKIVYICRNPFDTFVSSWIYLNKVKPDSLPVLQLEEAFEMYCNGAMGYGPFWNHMLGYWNESLKRPDKVMFLKYEEMKADIVSHLKKLAIFLGYPFSVQEEKDGVVEDLAELCSFEKMKELEVNKSGKSIMNFENKNLFRKAEIGDWVNYLSPPMAERLSKVLEEKLSGSGLTFKAAKRA
ncbi:cytosolic sulfotransferase 15-like [Rhodamnia argentea]|uniref:Sulfotransferase n=1 Tax=Rhodamnia argentea TaxID=178133 RepID=A0A8B8QY72_9MYRT|nr:cytosolic sulfotransferase 15-like [Rhodamnia argentea]